MRFILVAVLLCGCGSATTGDHDGGTGGTAGTAGTAGAGGTGGTGGAGGQVQAQGGSGGQGGHAGGAAGAPSSSTGGAGGASVPSCPTLRACGVVISSSCCLACSLPNGDPVTSICVTTAAENPIFAAPGPDYCVASPSACP